MKDKEYLHDDSSPSDMLALSYSGKYYLVVDQVYVFRKKHGLCDNRGLFLCVYESEGCL